MGTRGRKTGHTTPQGEKKRTHAKKRETRHGGPSRTAQQAARLPRPPKGIRPRTWGGKAISQKRGRPDKGRRQDKVSYTILTLHQPTCQMSSSINTHANMPSAAQNLHFQHSHAVGQSQGSPGDNTHATSRRQDNVERRKQTGPPKQNKILF